jgi:hypothetical protein
MGSHEAAKTKAAFRTGLCASVQIKVGNTATVSLAQAIHQLENK